MENLQTEVLELEFNEFSKGMLTITEEEFARILLRYTIFSSDDQEQHLERLRHRILDSKGISFEEFKKFGLFLNSLEDFAIAMKMYSYANQPVSQDVFNRAVKACTGQSLDKALVNVVFQLFDNDGDGHLSHGEFISVMKNRLHRGFRSQKVHPTKWGSFKSCVTNEMRA
ncbi:hypothetical protein NP493_19g06001 [Ridgeia piscesae]|uniref:EF-hand domain-containing protein n=1 Tax=Ridgeia piscesae TaxID=27915 RepID=A0AAD9PE13_RIDPI|nr:hypothetical protein NP493_19g06001 [Ridgeia piscesae]